ncbi:xanthine dehydrogenase molybdopterin binding subunit [Pseudosulfitobacter sp. DSM 107133]|uniref:xanthine dehydrogenase molybdopterin binding subunit n=1 Tax=Pseudosulfitobacter sp. DSM 107133 TaxID=2883100 RepID=UPI000DF3F803|nr:xanthine dehydrogenase molybdopterin binding subunit [Pseudosulfitobacter sp. DSM 107133]UOA28480.1 putative xanthine dehydrogenase subunit D [Pseudosulfitobacter sp. DSM 107133]
MSVARPLPHDAARLHVTGAARYVDDIPTPRDTLHLAFGTSTVAAGTLTALDLEAVRAAPGVVAVMTAADLPFDNDVSPSNHDEPLLATDAVHYLGQPLFLVIATSHGAARRAARLGDATIEKTTPILTIEQAEAADSRFEDGPRIYARGDLDAGFADAPHRLSGVMEIGGQEHFYLEGQAALALPGDNGDMHVHSSTQHPSEIQHKVAEAIGQHMHAVRVETRRMGGGFGGKESQGNALAVACAIAARATGRPCKMRYDRDDDMIITGKRHDFRITYDVAYDDAGRILALDVRHDTRCGWAMDLSLPVADRAMLHADNAYHLPAVRITSHRWKTNHQSATAFRGFGGPQGMLGMERIVDHVAHALRADPTAVRRANFYASGGDISGQKIQTTPYGQEVDDFIGHEMLARLEESSDYAARRAAVDAWNARGGVIRKGLALTPVKFGISFTLTHLNQAGALVHVYADGSVHLNHGGTEMGQGLFQKVAQVAASRFGVPMEAVRITATDTAKVPNTSATAASSGSDLNGMAVRNACDTIRERIELHLAQLHQCSPADVVFKNGRVTAGGADYSFAEVAALAHQARISLSSTGFYKTPEISWDRIKGHGRPFFYFAYGVAAVEVAVDTLTGENRMLRADILHDAGASLNPALDIGQVEGGFIQGAGWLTTEELVWDDTGALRTHAPSTYKIPACGDRPEVFNVALWDGENRADTIYKSKAVGEPPLMLGIATLMALSDAVASCGDAYPDLHAPATAEQMLAAVHRARGA